jgi:hypothetical protein
MLSKPCCRFCFTLLSSRCFPVVGRRSVTEFSLPNSSRYIQLFGKPNSDHVTARPRTSAEATPKNYEASGFRAAFGDYSADGGPGMHGSSPCMTKLKAQRIFLGGHIFCHARFGAVNPRFGSGHAVSILYAWQLARGADVRPLRPQFISTSLKSVPTLGNGLNRSPAGAHRSQQFHRLLACAIASPGAEFLVPRREARIPNSSPEKGDGSMP